MAQLPDANNQNDASIMDEVKVSGDIEQSFNDNDSLKNNFDTQDYLPDLDTTNSPITSIDDQRDSAAPGPPSSLTMQNMKEHDNANPSHPIIMGGMMGTLGGANVDIPESMVSYLIDMGFGRYLLIDPLSTSLVAKCARIL